MRYTSARQARRALTTAQTAAEVQDATDELAKRYSRVVMIYIRMAIVAGLGLPLSLVAGLLGAPFPVVIGLLVVGLIAVLGALIFGIITYVL